jgi:hypothetical protein
MIPKILITTLLSEVIKRWIVTLSAQREYLHAIWERYNKGTKKAKSLILDEFCAVCGLTRKHAIRLLRRRPQEPCRKPGPAAKYDGEFVEHLVRLWRAMRYMCARLMKRAIPLWLPYDDHPGLSPEIRQKLLDVSASTIDRLLKPYRTARRKGLSSTKPGSLIKAQIPIETLDSQIREPGYMEGDTVAHCGDSLEGSFVNTLTVTDLMSGWTANRACWNKNKEVIFDRIVDIRKSLPFAMKGFACDNGSEFINYKLVNYFRGSHPGEVTFTRRRPYKKNDAAHVEQKNDVTVRKLFGYERLDDPAFVPLLNEIYIHYWNPLRNHFFPMLKLKQKLRIGAKIRKIYDEPKTPYQRLIESGKLSPSQMQDLKEEHERLNPIALKKGLDRKLAILEKTIRRHKENQLVRGENDAA